MVPAPQPDQGAKNPPPDDEQPLAERVDKIEEAQTPAAAGRASNDPRERKRQRARPDPVEVGEADSSAHADSDKVSEPAPRSGSGEDSKPAAPATVVEAEPVEPTPSSVAVLGRASNDPRLKRHPDAPVTEE